MPTRPTSDHVYIREELPPATTSGGLFIPDSIRNDYHRGLRNGVRGGAGYGVVVRVGPGEVSSKGARQPMELKPGDRVMFEPAAGLAREIDGETLLVMEENHVLGVVES